MQNVSNIDGLDRLILVVKLLAFPYFWLPDAWQIGACVAGIVIASTAAILFCPPYKIFAIRTASGSVPLPRASLLELSPVMPLSTALGGSHANPFSVASRSWKISMR